MRFHTKVIVCGSGEAPGLGRLWLRVVLMGWGQNFEVDWMPWGPWMMPEKV